MPATLKYIIQLKGSDDIRTEVLTTWICGNKKMMKQNIEALKYNYKHGFLEKEYPDINKFKIVTSIEETIYF